MRAKEEGAFAAFCVTVMVALFFTGIRGGWGGPFGAGITVLFLVQSAVTGLAVTHWLFARRQFPKRSRDDETEYER